MFEITTTARKISEMTKFYRVLQGGSSAGKTVGVLLYFIYDVMRQPENRGKFLKIVSDTMPALTDGALKDFQTIIKEMGLTGLFKEKKNPRVFTYLPNDFTVKFIGIDDEMKARGGRQDFLFVNEANRLKYETFWQMSSRTNEFVIIDYNPSAEFWAHTEIIAKQPERTDFKILTYKDNEKCPEQARLSLEALPKDSNAYRVYVLGQIGTLEGNIYNGWTPYSGDFSECKLLSYGLDVGFEHPTALIALYEASDGSKIARELVYRSHMINSTTASEVVKAVNECGDAMIYVDFAGIGAALIPELRSAGLRATQADKGAGSVMRGITLLQNEQNFKYQGKSIEKEFLSYKWRTKSDGRTIEEPVKINDDAMDALRYAVDGVNQSPKVLSAKQLLGKF